MISTGVTSNVLLTVGSLLDSGASPNLVSKDFLLQAWKDSIKSIQSLQLQAANGEVVNKEGIEPLLICIGDLGVCTLSVIVVNLAVDVLV